MVSAVIERNNTCLQTPDEVDWCYSLPYIGRLYLGPKDVYGQLSAPEPHIATLAVFFGLFLGELNAE